MKAKELIDNLRTNLGNMGSQLKEATDQHVMYMLDEARATLASRKMDNRVNVEQMTQIVDIAPKTATKAEIGQIGEHRVLKVEIPDPIAYLNGGGIFTVGPTDGQDSYSRITYSQLRTAMYRKYTAVAPKWFFLENAVYIVNASKESLAKVRVRGIFDEPYKVEVAMGRYKRLAPFDWEYPLSLKDADSVYKLALGSDLGWGDSAAQAINSAANKQSKDSELLNALKGIGRQE